jgi:transposase-like protein
MAKKRFGPEQIVMLLRQIEVATAQGKSIRVACREAGISDQSFYRWRKEYGGLDLDQARKMKELEKENTHSTIQRTSLSSCADVMFAPVT